MIAPRHELIELIINKLASNDYRFAEGDSELDELIQQGIESDDESVRSFTVRLSLYVGEAVFLRTCNEELPADSLVIPPEILQSFQEPGDDATAEKFDQFETNETELAETLKKAFELRREARDKAGLDDCSE